MTAKSGPATASAASAQPPKQRRLRLYQALKQRLRLPTGARFVLFWHLASTIAGFALAAVLVYLEPFDLDRAIAAQGRSIFYKIASFAYPQAQSHAIVVLLDEDYLRHGAPDGGAMPWPVPYGAHAEAIQAMSDHRASAIFVDFLFLDPRDDPELNYLLATMRDVAEETPIYLAAPSRAPGQRARPEIEQLANEHRNIEFVSVREGSDLGQGYAYPMTYLKDYDDPKPAEIKQENRAIDATTNAPQPADLLRPAAVALARDYCTTMCAIRPGGAEMDIWWAAPRRNAFSNQRPFNCRGEEARKICERLPTTWIGRAFHVLTSAVLQPLPAERRLLTDPIPIPYVPTIRVLDLINANADWAHQPLRGATVFYGGQIAFAGDRKENPVNGQLVGVYTHAMAYDNLVALNGRYIQAGPPFGWSNKVHIIVLTGLLALMSLAARTYFTLRQPYKLSPRIILHAPELRARRLGALDATVFFAGAFLIAVCEFFIGHIGPSAWAPVLVAAAAGDLLSSRPLTAPVLGRVSGYPRLLGSAGKRTHERRRRERRTNSAAPTGPAS